MNSDFLPFSRPDDIAVEGDYAYVGANSGGVKKIDVSDPNNPFMDNEYGGFACRVVAVQGDYVYASDHWGGLYILNKDDCSLVGHVNFPQYTYGLAIQGDYAYVSNGESGLAIIDVSNPTNPVQCPNVATDHWANEVCVDDCYAYVSDVNGGLQIIDIQDPCSAFRYTVVPLEDFAIDAALASGHVYVGGGGSLHKIKL